MSQSDHLWKVPYVPLKFLLGSWLTKFFFTCIQIKLTTLKYMQVEKI